LHPNVDHPRRAGVSAFGFGGTNFHAVLEAYDNDTVASLPPASRDWPAELLAWSAADRAGLLRDLDHLADRIAAGARPRLPELAHTVASRFETPAKVPTLAIVATSHADLAAKLSLAQSAIRGGSPAMADPRGVYFEERPAFAGQPVAFIFPGQGSQTVGMLRELAIHFAEVRRAYEEFDAAILALGHEPIGPRIFPPPAFDEAARRRQNEALQATEIAQPAIGAASVGLLRLLAKAGVVPAMTAGHSYGELVALHAAGALDTLNLARLSVCRGLLLRDAAGDQPGAMAALQTGSENLPDLVGEEPGILIVNFNGPLQTVIAGPREAIEGVLERARARQVRGRFLPVACAFHTPRMEPAREPIFHLAIEALTVAPSIPVFSNIDGLIHPRDFEAIAGRLAEHVTGPVRFAEMIMAMHEQGARAFVEVGPSGLLAPLITAILGNRHHLAIACDQRGKPSFAGFLHALARLAVAGFPVRLASFIQGRAETILDLENLPEGDGSPPPSSSTWMVNGSRARPISAAEPKRLGQAALRPAPACSQPVSCKDPSVKIPVRKPQAYDQMGNGKAPDVAASTPVNPGRNAAAASDQSPLGSGRVLEAFQETMCKFLEVQRATMMAYLTEKRRRPADNQGDHPAALASRQRSVSESFSSTNNETPAAAGEAAQRSGSRSDAAHRPVSTAGPGETRAPLPSGYEAISKTLLDIVRERTGYPPDILRLDLDLEADLGIDSIKRVEILGKLREAFPQLGTASDSEAMERLASARTLAAVIDRVEQAISRLGVSSARTACGSAPASAEPGTARGTRNGKFQGGIHRLILEAVDAPLADAEAGLMTGGTVLITEDDRGVAKVIAGALRSRGWQAALIGGRDSRLDWTSPASVDKEIQEARRDGAIAGLVHLSPLRRDGLPEIDAEGWANRMMPEVRGFFLLTKAIGGDLERAAASGGACLIATTAMGGRFASTAKSQVDFFPGQGAVSGMIKTIAREWPAVRTRVIDLNFNDKTPRLAELVLAEVLHDDVWSEVGYSGIRRIRLRAVPAPLSSKGDQDELSLSPSEPVLVTGGARGITSLVAAELARRWQPTLLLIGTTPPSEGSDDAELEKLNKASDLKAVLFDRLRRGGRSVLPRELEQAYRALQRAREVRRNLERLRALGSRVEYARVDVRDFARLKVVVGGWRRRFGEPTGLVHGAGVIRDKLILNKSQDSFNRVLDTKFGGALNVARLVHPESLRFSVFFSSIAGRFGNRGQSDYAAANEALNKLAIWLDHRWPGRVVAPIWGPWSGIGMVSELEHHLGSRGLGMITPEVGVAALLNELLRGRKGEVEVVLAGDLGTLDAPLEPTPRVREALR
jgi:malonyl CoA-acyl carrier protein transacylase/NAD(P)-dependent dehydrogenase (short-subunit alcohol dehydrogenase family)/acyl carrier protein